MAEPIVIGPMITAFGMRSWYWACRPSLLVAVPGGFWVAIRTAMMTGGIGGVVGGLGMAAGAKTGGRLVERIQSAPDEELARMAGAVVYRIAEVQSIACKKVVLGTNPDFVVTTTDGTSKKYGLGNALAFDAVVDALRNCYGELIQLS
ncbi:MAG TPA: hypothetical protein VH575_04760 [Gemmataceae bacterium]|jgi:hypothetical protein